MSAPTSIFAIADRLNIEVRNATQSAYQSTQNDLEWRLQEAAEAGMPWQLAFLSRAEGLFVLRPYSAASEGFEALHYDVDGSVALAANMLHAFCKKGVSWDFLHDFIAANDKVAVRYLVKAKRFDYFAD